MSDLDQITTALERLFHEEGHRVVIWNDPEGEFQATLRLLDIDGVTKLELGRLGTLEVKIRVERQEPDGKFLLYSPAEESDFENDWLLDVRLYGRSLRADRPSILLQQLGLLNPNLRLHLAVRRKFFDSKERLQRLKVLSAPDDTAPDLDRKMMAVVTRADQLELFNIVRTVFHAWTEAGSEVDLDEPHACWEQMEKLDLDAPFWKMVRATFGYDEESPSPKFRHTDPRPASMANQAGNRSRRCRPSRSPIRFLPIKTVVPFPSPWATAETLEARCALAPATPAGSPASNALVSLHRGSPRSSPAIPGEATIGDTDLLPHARPGCAAAGKARLSRLGMVAWRS